jgi:hypothetical protein
MVPDVGAGNRALPAVRRRAYRMRDIKASNDEVTNWLHFPTLVLRNEHCVIEASAAVGVSAPPLRKWNASVGHAPLRVKV